MVDSRDWDEGGPPRRSRPFNPTSNSNYSIPLRPQAQGRLPPRSPPKGTAWGPSAGPSSTAGAPSLPARPLVRYRSPPPPGPGPGLPPPPLSRDGPGGPPPGRNGWGERGGRGWGGPPGPGRPPMGDRRERDRPPHDDSFRPSGAPGWAQGSHRGGDHPRKRSRGSSDDEADVGRHPTADWGRRASAGQGPPLQRRERDGKGPFRYPSGRYPDEPPPLPPLLPGSRRPGPSNHTANSVNGTPISTTPNANNRYPKIPTGPRLPLPVRGPGGDFSMPQRTWTVKPPDNPSQQGESSRMSSSPSRGQSGGAAPEDGEVTEEGELPAEDGTPPRPDQSHQQSQPSPPAECQIPDDGTPPRPAPPSLGTPPRPHSPTPPPPPPTSAPLDEPTPSDPPAPLADVVEPIEPTAEQIATVQVEDTVNKPNDSGTGVPHPLQATMDHDLFAGAVVPQPMQEAVKPLLIQSSTGVTEAVQIGEDKVVVEPVDDALPVRDEVVDVQAEEIAHVQEEQPQAESATSEAQPLVAEPSASLAPDEETPVIAPAKLPTVSPAAPVVETPSTPPHVHALPTSPLSSLKPSSPVMPKSQPASPLVNFKSLHPAHAASREVPTVDVEAPLDPDATSPAPPPMDDSMDLGDETIDTVRPGDFSEALANVIATQPDEGEVVSTIMRKSRSRSTGPNATNGEMPPVKRHVERDFPTLPIDISSHERVEPFLLAHFAERDEERGHKMVELRREYKALNEDWAQHCKRLDKLKRKFAPSTHPGTPSIDASGLPFYPGLHQEVSTPGAGLAQAGAGLGGALLAPTGRASRRSARDTLGYGDAVRSEAEFLAILHDLETADMRDPTVRASRTAAVVPDLILDDDERRAFIGGGLDKDDRRSVADPVEFYGTNAPPDSWTQEEVETYCTRFTSTPKQFGLIAEHLPDKTTAECVLFYYRMKNVIDFRVLSNRPGRDGKRRKPKKRAAEGTAKKGASLLSNLKRPRADEVEPDAEEEDDTPAVDSPPGSPQANRKTIDKDPPFKPRRGAAKDVDYREAPDSDFEPNKQRKGKASQAAREAVAAAAAAAATVAPPPGLEPMPPSDGALEAAEALGTLFGRDATDDHSDQLSYGGSRNGKAPMPPLPPNVAQVAAGAKRNNSYWSIGEREQIVQLLGQYGKDFEQIAAELGTKTVVQCKNWYQNHKQKLGLHFVAAGGKVPEGEDDSGMSRPISPEPQMHSHPLASGSGPIMPRAGFFTNEAPRVVPVPGGFAAVHDRAQNGLPSLLNNMPSRPDDTFFKKKTMGIRSLLNEDTPDEEQPASVDAGDWFGGGGGATGAGDKEEGSVTTVDEEEVASRSDLLGRRLSMGSTSAIGLNGMERSYSAGPVQPLVGAYRFEEQRPASVVGYHAQINSAHHPLAHRPHLGPSGASYHSAPGSASATPRPAYEPQLSPNQSRHQHLPGAWSTTPVGYRRPSGGSHYDYQRKTSGEYAPQPSRHEYDASYHHGAPQAAEYYSRPSSQPSIQGRPYPPTADRDPREVERGQRERDFFEPRAASSYRPGPGGPAYGPGGGAPPGAGSPQWR